jgi:hypothetical protein
MGSAPLTPAQGDGLNETRETGTTDLEREKLRLEILELRRPWYKKPAYIFPLVLVIGTLLTGFGTQFFQAEFTKFENQEHDLRLENESLKQQKSKLEGDRDKLNNSIARLTQDRKELDAKTSSLHGEKERLKSQYEEVSRATKDAATKLNRVNEQSNQVLAEKSRLQEEQRGLENDYQQKIAENELRIAELNRRYETEKARINQKILDTEQRPVVAPVQELVAHLDKGDQLSVSVQFKPDTLVKLLLEDEADRPRRLVMVQDALQEAHDPLLKSELLYVMFSVTREQKWKEQLFMLAESSATALPIQFVALLDGEGWRGSPFACELGVTIAKQLASKQGPEGKSSKSQRFLDSYSRQLWLQPCGQMAKALEAPSDFRDPQLLLTAVKMTRDLALLQGSFMDFQRSGALNDLYKLSRPAAYVVSMELLNEFHIRRIGESPGIVGPYVPLRNNAVAVAFEASKLPDRGGMESPAEWLKAHQKLAKLWMEDDLQTLRSNPALIDLNLIEKHD